MGKVVDKRLYGALKHVRRRMLLRHFIRFIMLGLIGALAQTVLWLGASFIIPIHYVWNKSAACGVGVLLILIAAGVFFRPSMKDAAHEADRRGLQERVITAYERMELNDVFSVMQREDTIRKLKDFDTRIIPVVPPNRWIYCVVVLALLLVIGFVIPNPQRDIIERQIRVEKVIEKQAEKLQEKVEDNLTGDVGLTEEEKQELIELVNRLADTLRQTRDYKEALKEISRAEQNLDDLTRRFQQARMASLGGELERHALTGALGQAIKTMDAQGITDELDDLKKQLEQGEMDEGTIKSLKKALEAAAKTLPEGSLKQQLMNAASVLTSGISGENGNAQNTLDALQEMLVDAAQGNMSSVADISYLLQNMKGSIANAAGQDYRIAQSGNNNRLTDENRRSGSSQTPDVQRPNDNGTDSLNAAGGSRSQNGSSSSGSGNGSQGLGDPGNTSGGQGSNNGSGSGGQGASGSGSGTGVGGGSTNQDAGYQEGGSSSGHGQKGQGDPDSYEEYERIYDPVRLGNSGQESHVSGGPTGQGTGEQVETGRGLGSFDGFIPYKEVFGSYSRQAMENLKRMDIPPAMRELVREYFSSLE